MSVKNTPFGGSQAKYHANYRNTPRERDKVGLSILNKIRKKIDGKVEIVDIGAGWGSFAYLIDKNIQNCKVSAIEVDDECSKFLREDSELSNISAIHTNIVEEDPTQNWDIATTVAVTCMFAESDFESLMHAITRLIKPGGYYIGWEFFHDIDQELEIKEFHEGISDLLCIRSIRYIENLFKKLGLIDLEFIPFEMPFDKKPVNDAITWSKKSTDILLPNLRSHTLKTEKGRFSCRGAMYQAWCHVIVRKA